jgi:hypothetical protein
MFPLLTCIPLCTKVGTTGPKVAVSFMLLFTVTGDAGEKPVNTDPAAGVPVSAIIVPLATKSVQLPLVTPAVMVQLIALSSLVTAPVPAPEPMMVKVELLLAMRSGAENMTGVVAVVCGW